MKTRNFLFLSTMLCALLAVGLYGGFWVWMAGQLREEMAGFIDDAATRDVTIAPRRMDVRGFPGTHEAYFSGKVSWKDAVAEVPALSVTSHFLPGQPLSVSLPQGAALVGGGPLWSFDEFSADTYIPDRLPRSLTREDLMEWRESGEPLILDSLTFAKGPLRAQAQGQMFLDAALQPAGTFNARITGHMEFLQWLSANGFIETKQALLAGTVLNGLAKADPDSGTYIDIALTLQNRTLFAGPIRLFVLPEIKWGWRELPAPYDGR